MCCNPKRLAFKSDKTTNATTTTQASAGNSNLGNAKPIPITQRRLAVPLFYSSVNLRYLGNSPITVRGPVTSRHYDFSTASPVRSVDPRDVTGLLGTQLFRSA